MKKCFFLLAVVILTSACAFSPQVVVPTPTVDCPDAMVGKGHTVTLNVLDERVNSVLGTRSVQGTGAEISCGGDLAAIVEGAISDGLRRQGFAVIDQSSVNSLELRVEIRSLSYKITRGFWMGGLRVECFLKAVCLDGKSWGYENVYRGESTANVGRVPSAAENEEYINKAISNAINLLLQDQKMLKALAA